MNVSLNLYRGVVYIPTCYLMKKGPIYLKHAPIRAVPVMETEALRQAILGAIAGGNPEVSIDDYRSLSRSWDGSLIEATGCKSEYQFDRSLSGSWSIFDKDRTYSIAVHRPMAKQGWTEDGEREVRFPPGASIDDVAARVIAMIQEREQQVLLP